MMYSQSNAGLCHSETRMQTNSKNCYSLTGFASGETELLAVFGDTSDFIFEEAIANGIEPNISSDGYGEYLELEYRGWNCQRVVPTSVLLFAVTGLAKALSGPLDGNTRCAKPMFD